VLDPFQEEGVDPVANRHDHHPNMRDLLEDAHHGQFQEGVEEEQALGRHPNPMTAVSHPKVLLVGEEEVR
jgi:hypothetical protein